MHMRAALVLLLLFHLPAMSSDVTAIRFGRLVDGRGKIWSNAVVIVRQDKIESVGGAETTIPAGVELIDPSDYTGIPGLIDVHTHMTFWRDETLAKSPFAQLGAQRPAFLVYMAQENARKTLEA